MTIDFDKMLQGMNTQKDAPKGPKLGRDRFLDLIKEAYDAAALNPREKSLITEDFYGNMLSEIFSGLNFDATSYMALRETKTLATLLKEEDAMTAQEIKLGLPKLRISEDWGVPGSNDRMIIQRFTAAVQGSTLEEKLNNVNLVATGQVPQASLSQILGTMVVLEVLSTILAQFTESAGGFIFEGFLAGLFGLNSVQITDVEDDDEATGKPITDVKLGDREYSLKLLNPKTAVKGSWRNMVEHFAGDRDHVVYLDARRSGSGASDSLLFSEFEITLATFLDVFHSPFIKYAKLEKKVKNKDQLVKVLEDLGDKVWKIKFDTPVVGTRANFEKDKLEMVPGLISQMEKLPGATIFYSEESFEKSGNLKRLFGSARQFNEVQAAIETGNKDQIIEALRLTNGYIKKEQFLFTPLQTKGIKGEKEIAFLKLGDEQLKKTWIEYGNILRKTVTPVYTSLARFNENVSSYFMGMTEGQEGDKKDFAKAAQQDLVNLKEATDEAISVVSTERARESEIQEGKKST